MNLEELKEAEDDFDEADRKAFEIYRQQCLQEWECLQRMHKYGELREICGEQYVKEVTNAPEDVWVMIHLIGQELEWNLAQIGALKTDLEENPQKDMMNTLTPSVQNISAYEDIDTKSSDVVKPPIT